MNDLALRNSKPTLFDSKLSPFGGLLDSFFDNNFWLDRSLNEYSYEPATYHYDEENKEHVINVQVPGFKKENIEVEVDNTGISLKGEITDETLKGRVGNKKFHYVMKKMGIDSKNVDASLEDGILLVKFKTTKEKTSKRIEVR